MPRLAITGASGFLGRYLCAELPGRGFDVLAVPRALLTPPTPGAGDAGALARILEGADGVIHLAGRAHVMRETAADPVAAYRAANVEVTGRVLAAARAAGVPFLVLASSVKAVGEASNTPWTEATVPGPQDAYGRSKLEAEGLVAAASSAGFRTASLRFPLMYGPGVRANMLRLFQLVDRGMPLPLGGIRNRRSLLFTGNAATAILALLQRGEPGAAYFVSDDEDLSTAELIRAIARALDRPARLLPVPEGVLRAAGRAGDLVGRVVPVPITSAAIGRLLGSLQVDISRLRAASGYIPSFTVAEGLEQTARWFRSAAAERP